MTQDEQNWDRLLDDYLSWLRMVRNLSAHTVRAYKCDLKAFGAWCTREGVDPLKASPRRLRGYLGYLVASGYADKTINRHLSSLRKMYDWLERQGVVAVSAFATLPGRKRKKSLPRTLSDSQVSALTASCEIDTPEGRRDAAFIEMLYATGGRISEIATLKPEDVDFALGQVRLFGKGRKERIVPLYDDAMQRLQSYINGPREELVARGKGKVAKTLFVSTRGNDMSANALRARFKTRVRMAGLDVRLSPHAVRHTYATELLNGGADLKSVQELLGHESLATTQIYTHLSVDRLKSATRQAHPRA